jgi:hypothetical protein
VWGHAAAESFFAALKNEMYHRETLTTRTRARFAVAEGSPRLNLAAVPGVPSSHG